MPIICDNLVIYQLRKLKEKSGRTCSDSHARNEIVRDSTNKCCPLQRRVIRRNEANSGNNDSDGGVEPVNVLIPVGQGKWLITDMLSLGGAHLAIGTNSSFQSHSAQQDSRQRPPRELFRLRIKLDYDPIGKFINKRSRQMEGVPEAK